MSEIISVRIPEHIASISEAKLKLPGETNSKFLNRILLRASLKIEQGKALPKVGIGKCGNAVKYSFRPSVSLKAKLDKLRPQCKSNAQMIAALMAIANKLPTNERIRSCEGLYEYLRKNYKPSDLIPIHQLFAQLEHICAKKNICDWLVLLYFQNNIRLTRQVSYKPAVRVPVWEDKDNIYTHLQCTGGDTLFLSIEEMHVVTKVYNTIRREYKLCLMRKRVNDILARIKKGNYPIIRHCKTPFARIVRVIPDAEYLEKYNYTPYPTLTQSLRALRNGDTDFLVLVLKGGHPVEIERL